MAGWRAWSWEFLCCSGPHLVSRYLIAWTFRRALRTLGDGSSRCLVVNNNMVSVPLGHYNSDEAHEGSGGRAVERRTVNRGDGGSIPPTAVSKLRQFRLPHICLCLSEETLNIGGPFYLVSMPGELKHPTHTGGTCKICNGLTNYREGQLQR